MLKGEAFRKRKAVHSRCACGLFVVNAPALVTLFCATSDPDVRREPLAGRPRDACNDLGVDGPAIPERRLVVLCCAIVTVAGRNFPGRLSVPVTRSM